MNPGEKGKVEGFEQSDELPSRRTDGANSAEPVAANLRAVIFDFDGVLGKTLEDNCWAWQEACLRHGVDFDAERLLLSEGRRSMEFIRAELERQGMPVELADSIVQSKNDLYRANHSFSLYEGADALLENLRNRGFLTAVVSGGSRDRLVNGPSADLLARCDTVVTGDDVQNGKPSPEPFSKAAQKLGVSPGECLVIENAPLGIAAAKAAGMGCVALCSTLSRKHLAEADVILEDLAELCDLLKKQGVLD